MLSNTFLESVKTVLIFILFTMVVIEANWLLILTFSVIGLLIIFFQIFREYKNARKSDR